MANRGRAGILLFVHGEIIGFLMYRLAGSNSVGVGVIHEFCVAEKEKKKKKKEKRKKRVRVKLVFIYNQSTQIL